MIPVNVFKSSCPSAFASPESMGNLVRLRGCGTIWGTERKTRRLGNQVIFSERGRGGRGKSVASASSNKTVPRLKNSASSFNHIA